MYIALLLLAAGCSGQQKEPDDYLTVRAFKAGKADSLLISHEGQHILLDTGEEDDGEKIAAYLQAKNIRTLQALIITHYDKDHVGGADHIVEALEIDHVYVPDYESDSKQTIEFLQAVDKKGLALETITETTEFAVGQALGEIYPPLQKNPKGDNDRSLVLSLRYGETSFLFAGDIEAPRITELLANPDIALPHTFLKVPHHGRFNEQTAAFIEAVQPAYAIITSSDKNPEHAETTAALKAADARIFTTRKGDVEFRSNGREIEVVQQGK